MDSTEDSGPMKPGNRAEDKTLTTGKQGEDTAGQESGDGIFGENPDGRISPFGGGKSWTRGERDTGRESTQRMDKGPENSQGAASSYEHRTGEPQRLAVARPWSKGQPSPAIPDERRSRKT